MNPPTGFSRFTWLPLSTVAPMVCLHVETVRRMCIARRVLAYRPGGTAPWLIATDSFGRVVNNRKART